jgi:hypothetical protein
MKCPYWRHQNIHNSPRQTGHDGVMAYQPGKLMDSRQFVVRLARWKALSVHGTSSELNCRCSSSDDKDGPLSQKRLNVFMV